MIKIYPHEQYHQGFTVDGHANYAEHGQDIVCASVSVATQMVAMQIMDMGYGYATQEDGKLVVRIDERNSEFLTQLIDMMLKTLYQIKEQYPEYITIQGEIR